MWRLLSLLGLFACGAQGAPTGELFVQETRWEVGEEPAAVLARDLAGRGGLDLVVASTGQGTITVLEGDGRGGFRARAALAAGENPVDVAAGDLDEDGRIDLVVANHETDYVTLLFGGEDGFAVRPGSRLSVGVAPHPHAVVVADLTGDRHLDLLVDDRDAEGLRLFPGRGDGRFGEGRPVFMGGDPYRGMAVADLNGDGHPDVVTPNPTAVAVAFGDGAGGFSDPLELRTAGLRPFSVAVADVNGDGLPDIGSGGGEGVGAFAVWFGRADGTFELDPGSPHRIAPGPTAVVAADVNDDGFEDFLVTSYVGEELAVLLGSGEELRPVRIPIAGNPWALTTGDFDGNGRTDVAVTLNGTRHVAVLLARGD